MIFPTNVMVPGTVTYFQAPLIDTELDKHGLSISLCNKVGYSSNLLWTKKKEDA
jgi:hypothetical protein